MKDWTTAIVAGLVACALVSAAQAEVYVYPKPGQSQDAFRSDQYECHNWAKRQTGFDPVHRRRRPPRRRRSRAARCKGAARGAAVGAVGGAIGGDAGKGAAVGAAVGGTAGAMRQNRHNRAVGASLPAGTVPAAGRLRQLRESLRDVPGGAWIFGQVELSRSLTLIGVLLLAGACATPIGVSLSGPKEIHRAVTRSVLTNGQPSAATEQIPPSPRPRRTLRQGPGGRDRTAPWPGHRARAATASSRWPSLSFIYAQQENRQDHYLAAAVYAYAFLFRKDGAIDDPLDSRTRLAADLYNFGLGLALAVPPAPARDE